MHPRRSTKRTSFSRLPALALALTLLLCGCAGLPPLIPRGTDAPAISYTVGDYDMVPFEDMAYQRPDMDALEQLFTDVTDYARTAEGADRRKLNDLVELCWDAYDEFYTMDTLAMLHSDIDQTDEGWADEYDFCTAAEVKIEQWLDRLLIACAASKAHVSSNLLAGYDEGDGEPYSDRALELMDRENSLLRDYWRVMMLDEIQIDGKTVSYLDYTSDPLITDEAYQAANLIYYQAVNEAAAPLYIELIKVRRELAAEFGYDSYEAYQFDSFARDYTPAQVRDYLDNMAGEIAPYYRRFMAADPYSRISYNALSPAKLLDQLEQATADMGKTVTDAFRLMKDYRLYDVTAAARKAPGAYTIYLDSYGAPFCYMGAYGDVEDFLDLSHEFGHFADAFCNYNTTQSLDLAETYSQAMANLALLKSRDLLPEADYQNLLLIHLLDTLGVFTQQTAYADFESRAYQLSDEELTVENLNALALSCAKRFGADADADDASWAVYWTQVTHLFESPFYVISYCISADAAVQIVEKEIDRPGDGVACYEKLLDWKDDAFLSEVERVGLTSPFDPGRAAHNLALLERIVARELPTYPHAA